MVGTTTQTRQNHSTWWTIARQQGNCKSGISDYICTKDDPPFLTIHGTNDTLVPFEQSVELTDSLQNAGAPAQLIPIQDGGHGRPQVRELNNRIMLFLENQFAGKNYKISTDSIQSPKPSR